MVEQPPRPIGTEFEQITETPTERIITVWRVVGHTPALDYSQGGGAEVLEQVQQTRQPKVKPSAAERKTAEQSDERDRP